LAAKKRKEAPEKADAGVVEKSTPFATVPAFIALCLGTLAYPFLLGGHLLADCDTGVHVRTGEWILRHMAVPRHDVFGQDNLLSPWVAHSWLSDVLSALFHRFAGLTGTAVLFASVLGAALFLAVRRVDLSAGSRTVRWAFFALVAIGTLFAWTARPHLFTMLFAVIFCVLAERLREGGKKALYALPAGMALWANLHGGFPAGLLVLGAHTAGSLLEKDLPAAKQTGLALLLCSVATFLTPYGVSTWTHHLTLLSDPALMGNVAEFLSPDFHQAIAWPLLLFLALSIAALGLGRGDVRAADVLMLAGFAAMSLWSARHSALLLLCCAPAVAGRISPAEKRPGKRGVPAWALALPFVLLLTAGGSGTLQLAFDPKTKPVGALALITSEQMPGNVLCDDEFGDWLIYEFEGIRYKPFVDGRGDVWTGGRYREYVLVMRLVPGYEDILDAHRVGWVLWPANRPLPFSLLRGKAWKAIYADQAAAVLVQDTPGNAGLIARHPVGESAGSRR